MWAADELDIDWQSFGRTAEGKRKAWKTGKVEPLAKTHRIAIVVWIAAAVVAFAMFEGRGGGNGREKDRDVAELAKQIRADQIAIRARLHKRLESHRRFRGHNRKIVPEHRA